jgi:hypothetical protein
VEQELQRTETRERAQREELEDLSSMVTLLLNNAAPHHQQQFARRGDAEQHDGGDDDTASAATVAATLPMQGRKGRRKQLSSVELLTRTLGRQDRILGASQAEAVQLRRAVETLRTQLAVAQQSSVRLREGARQGAAALASLQTQKQQAAARATKLEAALHAERVVRVVTDSRPCCVRYAVDDLVDNTLYNRRWPRYLFSVTDGSLRARVCCRRQSSKRQPMRYSRHGWCNAKRCCLQARSRRQR